MIWQRNEHTAIALPLLSRLIPSASNIIPVLSHFLIGVQNWQNQFPPLSGSIDYKLIETHLRDMLRVAVSIKRGKISASTILRRLETYSRKNKLYFAFRELGKVVRTVFLLRYINEIELRQTIQSATNKSIESPFRRRGGNHQRHTGGIIPIPYVQYQPVWGLFLEFGS